MRPWPPRYPTTCLVTDWPAEGDSLPLPWQPPIPPMQLYNFSSHVPVEMVEVKYHISDEMMHQDGEQAMRLSREALRDKLADEVTTRTLVFSEHDDATGITTLRARVLCGRLSNG